MATKVFLGTVSPVLPARPTPLLGEGIYALLDNSIPHASSLAAAWAHNPGSIGGPTEFQFDTVSGAGGVLLEWVSRRVPAGGFTLSGTMNFSAVMDQGAMADDFFARARVYRRDNTGGYTEVAGSPFTDDVELSTSPTTMSWSGTPSTGLAFAEDDRIALRLFVTSIFIASEKEATLYGDAEIFIGEIYAQLATTENFFEIAETVAFKPDLRSQEQKLLMFGVGSAENFGL